MLAFFRTNCLHGSQRKGLLRLATHLSILAYTDGKQRIERDGESVVIYRYSHEGMYLYSVNLEFDFGLNFPLHFTEVETVRAIMVPEASYHEISGDKKLTGSPVLRERHNY